MKFKFVALLIFLSECFKSFGATNSLATEAYVWQRDWNQSVQESVAEHSANFSCLVVLKAEVYWHSGEPQTVRVPIDYPILKRAGVSVGLALRIGPYAGPFSADDKAATFLSDLAQALIAEAKSSGLNVSELQIDFDCAESKLDGYRVWVESIRHKIAAVPLTITALPSWLKQPAFEKLVAATDGYVLQVHSLEAPKSVNQPFTLCDPVAAQRAVEQAGKFSIPFRVALPTYGYVIAFDSNGKFVGLSAEGPAKSWPANVQLREVRTDPDAMARLVRLWTTNHPAAMRGIIWYRLPVKNDFLNLRWPTLTAMMAGRPPREAIHATVRRVKPGLVEISLANDGELDLSSQIAVEARWQNARLVAGDGLNGFDLMDGQSSARFQNNQPSFRLPAGEQQIIGWLRLSEDREVQVEVKKF